MGAFFDRLFAWSKRNRLIVLLTAAVLVAAGVWFAVEEFEGGDIEFSGAVMGLSGTCPNLTFSLNGAPVVTNSQTRFKGAGCSAMQNGKEIEVEGSRQLNGSVLAKVVE